MRTQKFTGGGNSVKHSRSGRRSIAVVFTASFLLLGAGAIAHANTINFKLTDSGSAVQVVFSYDGLDIAYGTVNVGQMKPGGDFTQYGVVQTKADGKNCTVPGGATNAGVEDTLVGENDVFRFQPGGDRLYSHATASTACTDLSSGTPPFPFVANTSLVIDGGTGKYAGASGTITQSITGVILSLPGGVSGAGPGFGAFLSGQASGNGTLTTP
jgi:hypothetical protein